MNKKCKHDYFVYNHKPTYKNRQARKNIKYFTTEEHCLKCGKVKKTKWVKKT